MKHGAIRFSFILLALCFAGAAALAATAKTAKTAKDANFQWTSPTKRVILVEPDVRLSELDAGGILEPRADWTEAAQDFIDKDIRTHFGKSGAEVVISDRATPHDIQLAKLHGVVGQAILSHLYNTPLKLPNKGSALDWTLGPGTNEMRDRYGADYALFVFVRDSYSSPGRQALQVLGILGAAVGVGVVVSGGVQIGFASLVDLRTGNIVWFNRLLERQRRLAHGSAGPAYG
jgi:hypothetical protein